MVVGYQCGEGSGRAEQQRPQGLQGGTCWAQHGWEATMEEDASTGWDVSVR